MCRAQVAHLAENADRFSDAGARLVFVGCGLPAMAADFAAEQARPIEVYVDPKRRLYAEMGMKRGVRRVVTARAVASAARALSHGILQGPTQGDPWQLGGVLVVDRGGRMLWAHLSEHAGDHPDADTLLSFLPRTPARADVS